MKKKLLLLLYLNLSFLAFSKPIPDGVRYPYPNNWKRTDFNFSFHHRIPYSKLKLFWNTLDKHQNSNESPAEKKEMMKKIKEAFLQLCQISSEKNEITEKITLIEKILKEEGLDNDEWDDIFIQILWQKWNIIEGPTTRKDDPRNGFDAIPDKSHSYSMQEIKAERALKKLNSLMSSFSSILKNLPYKKDLKYSLGWKESKKLIKQIKNVKNMTQLLDRNNYLYNPKKWAREKKGRQGTRRWYRI